MKRSPTFSQTVLHQYNTEFGKTSVTHWQHLDRFESESKQKNTHVLFCGGSVNILEWVPNETDVNNQYLAISCDANVKSPFLKNSIPTKTCIQMWRMRKEEKTMHLSYIVALENGPIRCVAFCPSGGYDPATNRLAIVAVPKVSGDIYLMALPSPDESEVPLGATLKITPSLILQSGSQSGQVTQIRWSKVLH